MRLYKAIAGIVRHIKSGEYYAGIEFQHDIYNYQKIEIGGEDSVTLLGLWDGEIEELIEQGGLSAVYGKVKKDLQMQLDTYLYELTNDFNETGNEEIVTKVAQLQFLLGECD